MKKSILLLLLVTTICFGQTNYYVATNGLDTNSGTLASPWRTIQYSVNQMPPNSILNVFSGIYSEKITIPSSITIKNQSATLPIIDAFGITSQNAILSIIGKSNVIIDGLELRNNIQNTAQGILIDGNGSNITIKNCKIHDIHFSSNINAAVNETTNAQGIIVFGSNATNAIANLKIENNELYNCRLGYSEGIAINGNVNGFEVTGNNVHNITNIGIDIIGHEGTCPNPTNDQARNGIVKNNIINNCLANYAPSGGIYIDGGKSIIVENNTSYHNGYGIEVGCENIGKTTESIIIRNNAFYDNQICAVALGGFDYPNGSGKVISTSISNNTCLLNDYSNSGNGELFLSYSENSTIQNNIFYTTTQDVLAFAELTQPNLSFNYNNIYCTSGAGNLSSDWNGTTYTSFAALINGTSTNLNSIFGNPQLMNTTISNPDFHIQTNSPSKNAGNPSFVASNTETDFYKELRVEEGIIDCGADEFGSTLATTFINFENFSVYPNPSNGSVSILLTSNSDVKVTLTDIYGRLINSELFKNFDTEFNINLKFNNLSKGIYLLGFESNGRFSSKKLIIE